MTKKKDDITEQRRAEEALKFERAQLLSIFNSINEFVYVADPKTHEILYINNHLKNSLGNDPVGGICYREFQGKDRPCEFCTNDIILKKKGKPYQWEYHNPVMDRDFMIYDRIIRWPDGRDVRLELAIDITERKQTEKKLEILQFSVEHAGDAIHFVHEDARLIYVNEAACTMLGYTKEELLNMSVLDIDPSKNKDHLAKIWNEIKSKGVTKLETAHRTKDGRIIPVEVTAKYLEFQGEAYTCVFISDITERKKAEEKLRFFEFSVEHAGDAVHFADKDARIVYVNEKSCTMLGYSREEFLTMSLPDIDLHIKTDRLPEDWEELKSKGFIKLETVHRTKDGRLIPVEVTANYLEFEGKGYCCSFARDITERKKAEEKLRFFEFSLEHAGDAVHVLDEDTRLVFVNEEACKVLGYSREELLSLSLSDIDPNEKTGRHSENWKELKSKGFVKVETVNRAKDGRLIPVEVTAKYLEFQGETYACAFIRDISERKKAEEKLKFFEFSVENAADAAYFIDKDGKTIYVNEAACTMLGYTREDLLTMSVADIDACLKQDRLSENWEEIKRNGSLNIETAHRAKDGRLIPVEVTANYLEFEGNSYCCSFVRDITERKKVGEQLRLTQFSVDTAAVSIFWITPEGKIIFVNDTACKRLGYSREEIVGLTVPDIAPDHTAEMRPARWEKYKESKSLTFETRLRTKDGNFFPVEVTSNYFQFEGKEYEFAFVVDITKRKKAEENLRFTQFSVDRAGDAILWVDSDANIFYGNEAACRHLGYTKEELTALTVFDINPSIPKETWRTRWEEDKKRGAYTVEAIDRRKDGSLVPVEVAVNFIEFEGKEYHCVFVRDITDRKKVEEQLRLTQFSVDKTCDIVFWLDENADFLYVNETACRLLGYPREELLSMTLHDVDLNFPKDSWKERWKNLQRKQSLTVESRLQRKDGTIFPVEVAANYFEFEGKGYNFAFLRDITERKKAEEKLKFFEFLVEHAGDAVHVLDEDTRLVYVNEEACQMLGYTREELLALILSDIDPNEKTGRLAQAWKKLKSSKHFIKVETLNQTKDGRLIPVEVTASYLVFEGKGYCCAFLRDITERKKAEEELRKYEHIVSTSSDLLSLIDKNYTYLTINDTYLRVFQKKREEIVGHSIPELWGEDIFQKTIKPGIDTALAGKRFQYQEWFDFPDIGRRCLDMIYNPYFDEKREIAGVVVCSRDVTEKKLAEERVKRESERLHSLYKIGKKISPIISIEELLPWISELASRLFDDQHGCLYWVREGDFLVYKGGVREKEAGFVLKKKMAIGESITGLVAEEKRAIVVSENLPDDPRLIPEHARQFKALGFQSYIGIPIIIGSEVWGVLSLASQKPNTFGKDERDLLSSFADQAAIAIHNAITFENLEKAKKELEKSEAELRQFSRKIQEIREEEKKRFSIDLHDEVGAMAFTLNSNLGIIEQNIENNDLDEAIKNIRQGEAIVETIAVKLKKLAMNLRPVDLEITGLETALKEYFSHIQKQTDIRIDFTMSLNRESCSDSISIVLYRVAQEALNNIIKHAGAGNVKISLEAKENSINFSIHDDGKGFDVEKATSLKKKLSEMGIMGMRERVESLNGTFTITSRPGKGTTITINIPQ